jgi:hypothetical protein
MMSAKSAMDPMSESKPKRRRPSYLKHLWKDPTGRFLLSLVGGLFVIYMATLTYTAYFVYEDGRCFWVDCKIIEGDGVELLQIGD